MDRPPRHELPDAVGAHYERLLAGHYSWMLGGDIEQVAAGDRRQLDALGIAPPAEPERAVAVDLGCGPGPHALALADMGFGTVVGVDTSRHLLDELAERARSRPAVRTLHADLVEALPRLAPAGTIDVVVCMRDTLLHLPDQGAVDGLLGSVAGALARGGALVLSYRDISRPLRGLERFLPVRSDADRVMLCVLDYDDPDTVTVTDLVYSRTADGWDLQTSSYPKLRIEPDDLLVRIAAAGLSVVHHAQEANGMWTTMARR